MKTGSVFEKFLVRVSLVIWFTSFDLVFYFLLYFLSSFFIAHLNTADSLYICKMWLIWRLIKFQVFVQLAILFALSLGSGSLRLGGILLSFVLSYVVAAIFTWPVPATVYELFLPQDLANLGPGLALVVSYTAAYFACRYLWPEYFGPKMA